jgi:hypothetical protein
VEEPDRQPVSERQHGFYELQELSLLAGRRIPLHYSRNAHSTSTSRQPS